MKKDLTNLTNLNVDFSKLSKDEIREIQRILIDSGYLEATFKNKFGETKDSADGFWGHRSKHALDNFVSAYNKGEIDQYGDKKSENFSSGLKGFMWDIGKAKTGTNVPSDYMKKTRSGKATADEIADERIGVISDYITEDFGQDVNYNVASFVPSEKRTDLTENVHSVKSEFDKDWNEAGNESDVLYEDMYGPGWSITGDFISKDKDLYENGLNVNENGFIDIPLFKGPTDYSKALYNRLYNTKVGTRIQNVSHKGNGEGQAQLDDLDKTQWSKEYNTELVQMAEMKSQLAKAKADIDNALSNSQRSEAEQRYKDLSHRIALSSNAKSFNYNGKKINSFPQEYSDLINQMESTGGYTPETKAALDDFYRRLGVSPQWSNMGWGEKYTLDHLYGAGYSYYDNSNMDHNKNIGEVTSKLSDAINGRFTPRSYNGKNNGLFTMTGDRQGVHRHLTQRGEPLTNWEFNTAPTDSQGNTMNKPYFKIGDMMAWDWSTGKPKVALATNDNYHYGRHQQNKPMFVDDRLFTNKWMNRDWSNADSWSKEDKNAAAEFLRSNGFNIANSNDVKSYLNKENSYDWNSVKTIFEQLNVAKNSFRNPSAGQLSGENSFYHLPMAQDNRYTSNIFGNSITGVQMMNGKPYVFNQDNYDISTGPLSMFGQGTWYRNYNEVPKDVFEKIKENAEK